MEAFLKKELEQVNTRPENRENLLDKLAKDSDFFSEILQLVETDKNLAPKAARAIELAAIKNIGCLRPHINTILRISKSSKNHSVIRAMAKMLEMLTALHYKTTNLFQLQKQQLEKITEICFDWLITSQKTAAQVYSMGCLSKLGKDHPWIFPELLAILKKNYPKNTAGYQARARKVIQLIQQQ